MEQRLLTQKSVQKIRVVQRDEGTFHIERQSPKRTNIAAN